MRFGVAALMAAVGCLLFLAGRGRSGQQAPGCPPKDRVEHAGTADHGHRPSAPEDALAASPVTDMRHQQSGGEDQRSTQRHKWSRSEILSAISATAALAGAIFAAIALVIAMEAVSEARRQADAAQAALVAADRPWLRVVGLSDVRVTVREDHVTITTKITVSNIGRSPAQRAFTNTRLIANSSIDDEAQAALVLCQQAIEGEYYTVADKMIFPNETEVFFETSLIEIESIIHDHERRIQENFEVNRLVFGDRMAEESRSHEKAAPPVAGFSLVGCVSYIIPIGNVVGQTSFIYQVNQACGKERQELCAFYLTEPRIFEGADVIIGNPVGGTFAR